MTFSISRQTKSMEESNSTLKLPSNMMLLASGRKFKSTLNSAGKIVFVADSENGFVLGSILSQEGENLIVRVNAKEVKKIQEK